MGWHDWQQDKAALFQIAIQGFWVTGQSVPAAW